VQTFGKEGAAFALSHSLPFIKRFVNWGKFFLIHTSLA
jgi:hypothetical protein